MCESESKKKLEQLDAILAKKEEKSKKNNNNPRKRKLAAEIIIFGEKKIKINISIVCVVCERVFALSENCENIAKKK